MNGLEIESYANQEAVEESLVPPDWLWSIGAMAHRDRYFAGVMDEVRIYNKRLSDAEIMANFSVQSNVIAAVQPVGKLATAWGEVKAY